MALQMLEQYSSPNYTTPAQMPYIGTGEPRVVTSFTGHHWNAPGLGDTFLGVVAELCRPGAGKSAHYVVEGDHGNGQRAACIVSPPNAAWSCGNWHGNASTIAFELNPDECDSCYDAAGQVLALHWLAYGKWVFHPHNFWTSTDCPGTYDLARIAAIAENYYNGNTPTEKDEFDMASIDDLKTAIRAVLGEPEIQDAIALAILHRPCIDIDPSGLTTEPVAQPTTLAKKINWAAHNDAQILNAVMALHPAPDAVPATAPVPVTAPAPAPVTVP